MENNVVWQYQKVRESRHDLELGKYVTYGLRVQRRTEAGWEEIEFIHDVTTQRQFAKRLVELFNQYQLSALHFKAVVEDMLP